MEVNAFILSTLSKTIPPPLPNRLLEDDCHMTEKMQNKPLLNH